MHTVSKTLRDGSNDSHKFWVNHPMTDVHTWSSDVHIHAVVLYLALRRGWGNGSDAKVGCIQMLLCPFPVVRMVAQVQHGLLFKLTETSDNEVSIGSSHENGIQCGRNLVHSD